MSGAASRERNREARSAKRGCFDDIDEPHRYFVIPHLLLVLHTRLPEAPGWPALAILVLHSAINAATLYIFVMRPFAWADGSVARFMW